MVDAIPRGVEEKWGLVKRRGGLLVLKQHTGSKSTYFYCRRKFSLVSHPNRGGIGVILLVTQLVPLGYEAGDKNYQ